LDKDWFEFEKHLYGCRLWEGSLPTESLEMEQAVSLHLRSGAAASHFDDRTPEVEAAQADLSAVLQRALRCDRLEIRLKKDILDMGQFQSLRSASSGGWEHSAPRPGTRGREPQFDELLILKVTLEEDAEGMPASDLRAGDMVAAYIADNRDIAKYLAKLFGGHSDKGPVPIPVPIEAIESSEVSGARSLLVRVRFSAGVCGDAEVSVQTRLRAVRNPPDIPEKVSWWQRLFKK
jgi:hypothetical protein